MFYVNDEPEGKFLYTEIIKLYCIVLYQGKIASDRHNVWSTTIKCKRKHDKENQPQ